MNVYLLLQDTDVYTKTENEEGYITISEVLGVYETRERAEKEKARLDEEASEVYPTLEELETDPVSYYVEERPVLP